ncbi:MAG TPA: Ppx/GppA family phosphatase, partial [Paracoccaceae bacterium]|nr:Ppx/GppA family phosphatase [Paracoccaceae bacterium]
MIDAVRFPRKTATMAKSKNIARVGVVDVGSNSVRLVVFDGLARSPAYFYNEKVLCGLGRGMADTGVLHPEGRERALAAIHRFAALARGMGIAGLTGVATAAVREASDGPDFVEQVRSETGLDLRVIDGKQEAQLSAKGVLLGWPEAEGVVCDIGGSSMELAQLQGGIIGACETSELGPLKLADFHGDDTALTEHIRRKVSALLDAVPFPAGGQLFLVGGSWRALARIDMLRREYPFKVLHEYTLTPTQMDETIKWMRAQDLDALGQATSTSAERLRLLPIASRVLEELVAQAEPGLIAISSYGLREGMLYEIMPASMR